MLRHPVGALPDLAFEARDRTLLRYPSPAGREARRPPRAV